MQIKIYQINTDRDSKRLAFLPYEQTMRVQGKTEIDSSLYDLIFQGTVDCQSLEDVYRVFNIAHPEGYVGRSLSVSDIVEVTEKGQKRFYFCDRIGFKEVEFQPAQARSQCRFFSPLISELRETIQSGLFLSPAVMPGRGSIIMTVQKPGMASRRNGTIRPFGSASGILSVTGQNARNDRNAAVHIPREQTWTFR